LRVQCSASVGGEPRARAGRPVGRTGWARGGVAITYVLCGHTDGTCTVRLGVTANVAAPVLLASTPKSSPCKQEAAQPEVTVEGSWW
jgi:hypothetical protein